MTRRRFADLVSNFAQTHAEQLPEQLTAHVAESPRCPVARYLLGCHCLDRGIPATGVRHLMIAHHAEPDLQSAALLAFAGLNWIPKLNRPLLPVLLETWDEFRRPEFDRRPREQILFDAFAEHDPGLGQVSELARRLWRLPIGVLRTQLREAVASRDTCRYPLLIAPV